MLPERVENSEAALNHLKKTFAKSPTKELTAWPPEEIQPSSFLIDGELIFFIDVIGLPRTGKTTTLSNLSDEVQRKNPHITAIINPEFGKDAAFYQVYKEVVRARINNFHFEGFFLDEMKLAAFWDLERQAWEALIESIKTKRFKGPVLAICERGPNCVLASERAWDSLNPNLADTTPSERDFYLAAYHLPFFETHVFPSWQERWKMRQTALNNSRKMHAVIFFKNSVKTTIERHGRLGQFINPQVLVPLGNGYSWWREFIYPQLKDEHGTGLMVIDGEKDFEENFQAITNYLLEMVSLGVYL